MNKKGSKKSIKNKKITSSTVLTTTTTRKPTKPDLKSMGKIQKTLDPRNSNEDHSFQKSKHFSKQALDSLLSKNKNAQFSPSKFHDTRDYLERLNDDQQSDFEEDDYEDEDEDEDSIHPISSDTDPIKLLHDLTNSNSKKYDSITDDTSHYSNLHTTIVTRKPPLSEDSKHVTVPLPGAPRAVQAPIIKPRFVTLNWLEPEKNPDEVVSYTVFYKMNAPDAR